MQKPRIAVLIPDRNDRPRLLENCLGMMERQTLKPDVISVIDYPPTGPARDITTRYRKGYDFLSGYDFDCILLIENDDWYAPDYIEYMVGEWERAGRPDIFGTNYTIYYNLGLRAYFTMEHFSRSSAMSTLIKPKLFIRWPQAEDPYTDIHLWKQIRGVTFRPDRHICLGIKHNTGLTGGMGHSDRLHRFVNKDPGHEWLRSVLDPQAFKFYSTYL